MKKLIFFLIFNIFFISNIYGNFEENVLNSFSKKIKNLNYEQLEDLDYGIDKLKKEYKKTILDKAKKLVKNEKKEKIYIGVYDFLFDVSSNSEVVSYADNVFVAKVIKKLGQRNLSKDPYHYGDIVTDFEVEVLYNIKGKLSGKQKIVFNGGYGDNGILYTGEGIPMLREGNVYLLGTLGKSKSVMVNGNGSHLIFNSFFRSSEKIEDIIRENKKVKNFWESYKTPSKNVKSKQNNYNDLSNEEKKVLENFENGFVK